MKKCLICGNIILGRPNHVKKATYCSRNCYVFDMTNHPERVPAWRGGIQHHTQGYILHYSRAHPHADKHGYVPEHRLVMEKIIGRYIDPTKEEVHHINHKRDDNRPENLQLFDILSHHRIENGWRLVDGIWFKNCRGCKNFLAVTDENFLTSRCRVCTVAERKRSYNPKKRRERWLREKRNVHLAEQSMKNGG